MKIAVECKSPLLQKSLEVFLSKHICASKQCDIIIKDEKDSKKNQKHFYISSDSDADLQKPFTKSQLILALEERYKTLNPKIVPTNAIKDYQNDDAPLDFAILEERIEYLTQEYQQNVLKAIKAFYEK